MDTAKTNSVHIGIYEKNVVGFSEMVMREAGLNVRYRPLADTPGSRNHQRMDGLLRGLAEDVIEWVDDRVGRRAAWIVGVLAVLTLVIGVPALVVAALRYLVG